MRLEPCIGKSATRSGLQIFLKSNRASLIRKRDVALDTPGSELRCVCHFARIVFREPGNQVIGDAGVEMLLRRGFEGLDIFHGQSACRP